MNVSHILEQLGAHFVTLSKNAFTYGPQGKMLLKNLEEHWFLHCITMSRCNVFLSDDFSNTLNLITKSEMSDIPFGLATIKKSKDDWNRNESIIIKLNSHKTAETAILNNNMETRDLFYQMQKERKIWWRRLAQCPSRFKLTEAKKVRTVDSVEIQAQFPFGNIIVERITYHTDVQKFFSQVLYFILCTPQYVVV